MSRKVTYARLQTGAYAPHTGELGNTFPPPSKTLNNLNMEVSELGLFIKFDFKAQSHEILVPHANVMIMVLTSEDKPVKPALKLANG